MQRVPPLRNGMLPLPWRRHKPAEIGGSYQKRRHGREHKHSCCLPAMQGHEMPGRGRDECATGEEEIPVGSLQSAEMPLSFTPCF